MRPWWTSSLLSVSLAICTSAELVTITTSISACSARPTATCVPQHVADHCNFDARRDLAIGKVDLRDPAVRRHYYPSNSLERLSDDMPHLGTAKANVRRWFGSGIWNDVSSAVSSAAGTVANVVSDGANTVAGAVVTGVNAGVDWVKEVRCCNER